MEYLDIVDEYGNPNGKTIERTVAHAKGGRHRTSHVWLVRKKNEQIQILLQKRASNKDSYPGCYDISSAGHIPAGKDWIESALRELQEELSLQVSADELIECGMRKIDSKNIFHNQVFIDKQVSKVFLLWKDQDSFRVQKEEIESVRWMNFEECYQKVKENTFKHCIALEELDLLKSHLK